MLRKLRALKLYLRNSTWVNEPEWLREDEDRLRNFFGTETGKKLKMTLLNLTLRHNAEAVRDKKGLEYSCGWASGFSSAVVALETLATPRKTEETGDTDDQSDLARYSP